MSGTALSLARGQTTKFLCNKGTNRKWSRSGARARESDPLREADTAVGKAVRLLHLTCERWIAQEQPTEVGGLVSQAFQYFIGANRDKYCAISGVRRDGVVLKKALAP